MVFSSGDERVLDHDPVIDLAVIEILRPDHIAVELVGAPQDHRVPEGKLVALLKVDGAEHILGVGDMHPPVAQVLEGLRRASGSTASTFRTS